MKAKRGTTQGGRFTIREAGKPEPKRFDKLLEEKHPQQKPKRVGHELRMIVEEDRVGLVRNHWAGVENRLHWRKDACLREDHTRSRNAHLVGALALLRIALFAIHQPHLENYGGLNDFTEAVAADVSFAYRLIMRPL